MPRKLVDLITDTPKLHCVPSALPPSKREGISQAEHQNCAATQFMLSDNKT